MLAPLNRSRADLNSNGRPMRRRTQRGGCDVGTPARGLAHELDVARRVRQQPQDTSSQTAGKLDPPAEQGDRPERPPAQREKRHPQETGGWKPPRGKGRQTPLKLILPG